MVSLVEAKGRLIGYSDPLVNQMNNILSAAEQIQKIPPIGAAPAYLDELERAVWNDLAPNLPWLRAHHTDTFACYCALVALFRGGTRTMEVIDKIRHMSNLLGSNPRADKQIAAVMHKDQDDSNISDAERRFFSNREK